MLVLQHLRHHVVILHQPADIFFHESKDFFFPAFRRGDHDMLGFRFLPHDDMLLSNFKYRTDAVTRDDSHLDPAMTRGATLTLVGDQAEYYVRRRMDVSDGTNESRMRRQQDYIGKISGMLNQRISADKNFVGTLYDMLSDYLVTDLARGRLINEAWNARHYARSPLREIPGTHTIGKNGYVEFYADGAALQDLIVELFYEPLK